MTADEPTLPASTALDAEARAVLERHWCSEGYCVPNAATYPFAWLWDSCFHAVVWAHLGEGARAVRELRHVFRTQDESGFVPHVDYEPDPDHLASFWGRRGASSITQPPMFGHALAELTRRGVELPDDVVGDALRGLRFLLDRRARDPATGLVTIVHPWESGADDSPRWDHWCADGFEAGRWYDAKGALLRTIRRDDGGAPLGNPSFGAAPAGFNALVAFNASELAWVIGDEALARDAQQVATSLAARWDGTLATWIDGGPAAGTSGQVRTLDALLPALVDTPRAEVALASAVDDDAFGGRCGPAGVHRAEPSFSPRAYWRGAAWPQLTYLLWVAARRCGATRHADRLATTLVRGATRSGFAEYWDPDDGTPLGAVPQSWATLAAVVQRG